METRFCENSKKVDHWKGDIIESYHTQKMEC